MTNRLTAERRTQTPDILTETGKDFYEVCGATDDEFERNGIDLDGVNPAEYWMAAIEQARTLSEEKHSEFSDLPKSASLELAAATPRYLIALQRINSARRGHPSSRPMTEEDLYNERYFMSYYNGLLRFYIGTHTEVAKPELSHSLVGVLKRSGITKHPEAFQRSISERINGQHTEIIAAQILSSVPGYETRPTTVEDDLQGLDAVMRRGHHMIGFGVDAKTSPYELKQASGEHATRFAVRGGVILYCPELTDEEHGGKFYLDPEVAARKASQIRPALDAITSNQRLRSIEF